MSPLKAALLASLERYFGFAAAFVTSIVISRLLTPAEVGTFSVAMAIAGIAGVIREFGAASYLIRSPTITERHESCAFGLSLLLGCGIGTLLLAAAPFIGSLFANETVTPVLQLLCLNFFIVPFGTVQSSLLQRTMRFDVLARIGIAATVVSMTTSITLAWHGYGTFALAIGAISLTATASILSILMGPAPWIRLPRISGSRELLTFGLQNTGLSMIWEINGRFPDFIIGHAAGMHAAGLLSRASSLASSINDVLMKGIGAIALPYLSKIQRDTGDANNAHLKLASIVTALGMPLFCALAYLAAPITLLLYGEKWLQITTSLRLLCLLFCVTLPFSFQLQLVIAKGHLATQLRASAVTFPLRLCIVGFGAYAGGLNGMAAAMVLAQLVSACVASIMVWPSVGLRWINYWGVINENKSIILAIFLSTIVFELLINPSLEINLIKIVTYTLFLLTCLIVSIIFTNHHLLEYGKKILKRKKEGST